MKKFFKTDLNISILSLNGKPYSFTNFLNLYHDLESGQFIETTSRNGSTEITFDQMVHELKRIKCSDISGMLDLNKSFQIEHESDNEPTYVSYLNDNPDHAPEDGMSVTLDTKIPVELRLELAKIIKQFLELNIDV